MEQEKHKNQDNQAHYGFTHNVCEETLTFTWLGLALHGDCDGITFSCEDKRSMC